MPAFGPLTMLLLLCYVLFLGVVMALWFALSPRRDRPQSGQSERRAEEAVPPAEPKRKDVRWDEVRGANARRASREEPEPKVRVVRDTTREEPHRSPALTTANTTSREAKPEPAKPPEPPKKRREDAFEDFIRSKNDDFEF